jgi:hypothetical protein
MKFNNPYWNSRQKIEMLSRWILVHSYLYYDLDKSIVEDHTFDLNSKQLVKLQEAHKSEFKQSRYFYVMKDFDGSSGFGLCQKLNDYDYDCVTRDAVMLKERYT